MHQAYSINLGRPEHCSLWWCAGGKGAESMLETGLEAPGKGMMWTKLNSIVKPPFIPSMSG